MEAGVDSDDVVDISSEVVIGTLEDQVSFEKGLAGIVVHEEAHLVKNANEAGIELGTNEAVSG